MSLTSSQKNPLTGLVPSSMEDMTQALMLLARVLQRPSWVESASGRMRAIIELAASQTLATVTTVTTVTSMTNMAGHSTKDTHLAFADRLLWSSSVRGRIS